MKEFHWIRANVMPRPGLHFVFLGNPFFPTVPLSTQEYTWLQLTHLVREMKSWRNLFGRKNGGGWGGGGEKGKEGVVTCNELANIQGWEEAIALGPVVRRPFSCNPRLNFNLGFFIPLFKSLFGIISCLIFKASNNHILDKKNLTEFSFKAIRSEIRFYTNPELS